MGVVSPWRAMLLASVAAGREYHVMHCDGTTLAPPPEGFDSVSVLVFFFFLGRT